MNEHVFLEGNPTPGSLIDSQCFTIDIALIIHPDPVLVVHCL